MMEGYSPKVAKTIKPFAVGAAAGVQTGKKGPVGGFAVALEVGNASGRPRDPGIPPLGEVQA